MALSVQLLRPDDLVHLTIEGHNLRLDTSDPATPHLVHEDAARDAFLVAVFPPQSFAEQALVEVDPPGRPEDATGAGNYAARLSGPTRLAFRVPPGMSIPFSIEGLLDWSKLEPSLTPVGSVVGQPGFLRAPAIVEPSLTQTAIELPYRVFLSPGPKAQWRHAPAPKAGSRRTALWHTRLVALSNEGNPLELNADRSTQVRAVYSPDYEPDKPPRFDEPNEPRVLMSLKPYDRHWLVALTSSFPRFNLRRSRDVGKAAETRKLALSSLGGFLDAYGQWPDGFTGISFLSWKHVAALGRDAYVRVAYRGRLLPLMNRATLIKITERRFEPSAADGSPVAYLRQYMRILIDEKEVRYEGQPFVHDGREMPLARVRINVDATPKIENPDADASTVRFITGTSSFEVKLGSEFWPFPCTSFDRAGNAVDFPIGMIFVPEDDIPSRVQIVADHYRGLPKNRTAAPTNNARVKLADFGSSSETTVFVATSFQFDVDVGPGGAGFLPRMAGIDVRVPSLELLTGSPKPASIQFTKSYLDNGLDPEAGLFAEIAGGVSLPAPFSADQAGGIVRPDLSVRGFSRNFGPIAGDLTKITAGKFDPASAFGSLDAKLFGALPIKDILGTSSLAESYPRVTTGPDPDFPGGVLTHLHWETPTKAHGIGAVQFTPGPSTLLSIDASVRKRLSGVGGAPPSDETTIVGVLNAFTVELMEVVLIGFAEFRFSSGTGRSAEVVVKLADVDPIQFKGALGFVAKLTEIIPPGIFGQSGPRIVLRPDAIEVGFSLPLPPAAIGIFSIRNIAISTALTLPFLSGRPSLAFAFATREKPFCLAVLILGGGGFVRIELDTEGIRGVEVMFEFGGVVALDVGVASGAVQIMAGIYIGIKGEASELTGYVRVSGEVTALLIVSVSIEFMLSLSFIPATKTARGVARVTISVRIAFISKSLTFSVERSFSGGSRHLSIAEAMSPADWADYAGAFA